ncbi:NPCBM/NEW2 domain-containing protein [Streptomyces sp. E11-3]|uniref:NPCBM/NEW2 domain-containing protein n=1 Tax=Streptomyces sp. E11-3 TaxID=3110112 RepID=UPI003981414D
MTASSPDRQADERPAEEGDPPADAETDGSSPEDREAPRVAPQQMTHYLSGLDPVGGLGNFKSTGASKMNGTTYANSVRFHPSYFQSNPLSVTYNVPAGTKSLKADVGLDDETLDGYEVHFEVKRNDGSVVFQETLRAGAVHDVDKKVSGVRRITITVKVIARPSDAINNRFRAVVGNGRFE